MAKRKAEALLSAGDVVRWVSTISNPALSVVEAAVAARRGLLAAQGLEPTAPTGGGSAEAKSSRPASTTLDITTLARTPVSAADVAGKSEVRVLLNGCFDIMHAGHYNALRQAKAMFSGLGVRTVLVAGVHTDRSIIEQKGPPVMCQSERIDLVEACKWVDEVVVIPEYIIDVKLLDSMHCDFVAHGDDLPIRTDGTGMYHEAIFANRFRMIKRTEGVSTTTFIGRLLQATRPKTLDLSPRPSQEQEKHVPISATLLPTGSRLLSFVSGVRPLGEAKRVVYVDGTFDVFHVGHVAFLKMCAAKGDYLLVGLHSDEVSAATHGPGHPIMALHERALCLLACKYVDDVILGAPVTVTKNLCTTMNITVVASGSKHTNMKLQASSDHYAVPKELGMFTAVESGHSMTTATIRERIVENYVSFKLRNESKEKAEVVYEQGKTYFVEHGGGSGSGGGQ